MCVIVQESVARNHRKRHNSKNKEQSQDGKFQHARRERSGEGKASSLGALWRVWDETDQMKSRGKTCLGGQVRLGELEFVGRDKIFVAMEI